MNYARAYERFIADRRSVAVVGYGEDHHIVPRCMGGVDERGNLIRLSPEDHYFAHLLLAHAYGGPNWPALYAMANLAGQNNANRRPLKARVQFGHVRRKLAAYYRELLSGPDGPIADKRSYALRHTDGREVSGNRFELEAHTGISRQRISALLRGAKGSCFGWYSPTHNPDGAMAAARVSMGRRQKAVIALFHYDGLEWFGTKWDFHAQFGAQLSFQHPEGCVLGWYRTREQAAAHGTLDRVKAAAASAARGDISGVANPNADKNLYRFRIVSTGEIVTATKTEIRARFGIRSAQLCSIFSGRQRQTGGIALANAS